MKKNSVTNEFAEPVRHLVADMRELLAVTAHVAGRKAAAVRRYLDGAIRYGGNLWYTVQAYAVSGAKAADRLIRGYPYPSVGIALVLGLLLGFLAHGRE